MSDKSGSILVVMGGGGETTFSRAVMASLAFAGAEAKLATGVKNLRNLMAQYKVVVTYYGLSAFEALAAGCAVILVAPTREHKALARRAGFAVASVSKLKKPDKLKTLINEAFEKSLILKSKLDSEKVSSIESIIRALSSSVNNKGVVCDRLKCKVVYRSPARTFSRDERTGVIYLTLTSEVVSTYGEKYFTVDYKAQYGVTYLEDFAAIKAQGVRRLSVIEEIFARKKATTLGKKLLDVGCAYGAFLEAAKEKGFLAEGLDVCSEAIEYARKTLGFKAKVCSFMDADEGESFDVLSMWYVIEHLEDLGAALLKVAKFIKRGGIFAFSTPNASGVTARRNLTAFLRDSPSDHLSILCPKSAKRFLARYGFKVVRVLATTTHIERFPKWLQRFPKLCAYLSRVFVLSDTFELYAVKK